MASFSCGQLWRRAAKVLREMERVPNQAVGIIRKKRYENPYLEMPYQDRLQVMFRQAARCCTTGCVSRACSEEHDGSPRGPYELDMDDMGQIW